MVGPTGKGKEKEPKERKKPGRIPTSCAECRRLKLKCDKKTPCSKCVSRGCGSICPDGSLTPGKGNRLVLANTEELHDRIDQMASRNRELESALRELQKRVSDDPHPLLRNDLLGVNFLQGSSSRASSSSTSAKSPTGPTSPSINPTSPFDLEGLYEEQGSAHFLGTLYLDRRGESRYFGKTSRPEYLIRTVSDTTSIAHRSSHPSQSVLRAAFPEHNAPDPTFASDLLSSLPSPDEARRLWAAYLEYGKYLYQPISEKDLPDYLFTTTDHSKPLDRLDDLALLFIIFAIGALFDVEPQHSSSVAYGYYALSRAALNLSQPSTKYTLRTLQATIHISQFIDMTDVTPAGSDTLWLNLGDAIRLSHNFGLHLDSTHWKVHEDLGQRRHELFWNLFVVDTWASINVGKPPSILRSHVNCPFPRTTSGEGHSNLNFHSWHARFTLLVHTVAEMAMGPKKPIYSVILNFDRLIREFDVPAPWRMPDMDDETTPSTLEISIYRWLVLSTKEVAILNLHRPYLAAALHESPAGLQRHRFLPSVVACYKASWRIMQGLARTSIVNTEFLSRVNMAWSQAMSAAILISLLITKAPASAWAGPALEELDRLASLFHSAAPRCPAAAKFHPTLEALQLKAHDVIGDPHVRSHYPQDGRTMSTAEVERLSGQTQLVMDHSLSGSSLAPSRVSSRATSVTISDMADFHQTPIITHPVALPANELEGMHPSLSRDVEEYRLRNTVLSTRISFHDLPAPAQPSDFQKAPQKSSSSNPTPHASPYPAGPTELSSPVPRAPSTPQANPQGSTQLPQIRAPRSHHHQQSYVPSSSYSSSSYTVPPVRDSAFSSHAYSYQQPALTSSTFASHLPSFSSSLPPLQSFIPPPIQLPTGFQPVFQTHSWLTPSPTALDPTWTPFVEQLGYC